MAESTRGRAWSAHDPLGLVGAATALIDARGIIIGWTGTAEQIIGWTAAEVVGRSAAMLLVNPDTAEELAAWGARPDREPWSGVVQIRRKNGTGVKMMIEASPLAGDGRTDWFVMATDPTGASSWFPGRYSVSAALLARSPIGLSIWDTNLRCIWMNSAAETQDGFLRRQRLGRLMTEVQPGGPGLAISAAMRQVLATGEAVIEREYTWKVPGEDEERVLSASYFRIDGADGEPIGVVNMATDIDKSRVRQHLLILGQAGNRIGTTLDVTRTSQELADAAVPLLADYVTVDLAETVPLGEEPLMRVPYGDGSVPVVRRVGVASIHEGLPETPWKLGEAIFIPPASPFTRSLLSGQTHFEPVLDTSPGSWLEHDPVRARSVRKEGMHSLIIVPLQARGTILGEATFIRTENKTPFSGDDLLLIEELCDRAALSLDNARRYTRERAASVALQRNLLPHNLSGGDAVELASRYLPADTHEGVGGDWFDAIPLSRGRVGLVVGDVVGHGINAAALMGQLRTVMRTLADLDLPPEELLARLDRLVLQMAEQEEYPDSGDRAGPVMSCTCVYAVYDAVAGTCTMASAGHPPPAVVYPDGQVVFPRIVTGPPIGLGERDYQSVTLDLPENSVIALYTDGLIETRTDDLDVGMRRLHTALSWTGSSLDDLCTQVISTMTPHAWRNMATGPDSPRTGTPSEDDIALLLARTRLLTPEQAAGRRRP